MLSLMVNLSESYFFGSQIYFLVILTVLNCRYLIDNGYVCGKFSYKEMRLNYYHVASDRLRFGVEFYRNFENNDTNAIFAYQFNVNEDNFLYKGG